MDLLFSIVGVAAVVFGVVGTLLPGLPGPVLVYAGLIVLAWVNGFDRVGAGTLALLGIMTVAAYGVDLAAAALGVRRAGASRRAVAGAALGTVLGLFFGIPGLIIGPFAGALALELSVRGDIKRAGRVGVAAWIGFVLGLVAKVALVAGMIGIFAMAFFL